MLIWIDNQQYFIATNLAGKIQISEFMKEFCVPIFNGFAFNTYSME